MQSNTSNADKFIIKGMLTELTQLFQEVSVVQEQLMTKLKEMESKNQGSKTSSASSTPSIPSIGSAFSSIVNSLMNGEEIDSHMVMQAVNGLMNPQHTGQQPSLGDDTQYDDMPPLEDSDYLDGLPDSMQLPKVPPVSKLHQVPQVPKVVPKAVVKPVVKPVVINQGHNVQVKSQTENDKIYSVNIMNGSCTCPHFKYSGPLVCKHIMSVQNNPSKYGLTMYDASQLKNVTDDY